MRGGCALAALVFVGAVPTWARAASLRDSLGASADDRFTANMQGRFRSDSGEQFVLERTPDRSILLRFDTSPEIWVLRPYSAPRGDVIYRNDVGDPVLRATRVGGLTLFTALAPAGAAAAFVGAGPPLRPNPITTTAALLQSFTLASARAGRAGQQLIYFEAKDVPLPSASLFADSAQIVSEAFIRFAAQPDRRGVGIGRWSKVEFVIGRNPDATAAGGVLRVALAPERGLAGRPSSSRLLQVLSKAAP